MGGYYLYCTIFPCGYSKSPPLHLPQNMLDFRIGLYIHAHPRDRGAAVTCPPTLTSVLDSWVSTVASPFFKSQSLPTISMEPFHFFYSPSKGCRQKEGGFGFCWQSIHRQPDCCAQLRPLLTLLCQKSFCFSFPLGHISKYPLCFLASVCARLQQGDGEGGKSYTGTDLLRQHYKWKQSSNLREAKGIFTLKRVYTLFFAWYHRTY